MGIKRYYAKKDNTITNAFMENLSTRGTGSNMGASDILEVFSIYGQASASSGLETERSRALIKFDCTASTNSIKADRDASTIPASGSVSFYLRVFNAPHGQTLPKNYTMDVSAVSGSWDEGTGLDMELYKDKGKSNWEYANNSSTQATLVNAINTINAATGDKFTMTVPVSAGGDGVAHTFTIYANASAVDAASDTTGFGFAADTLGLHLGVYTLLRDSIILAINGSPAATYGYGGGAVETGLAAGTLGLTATAGTTNTTITLTMDDTGQAGNVADVLAANTGFEGNYLLESSFTDGSGPWSTAGGDYYSDSKSSFSASFDSGTEDIEMDITTLVEQWVDSAGNILGGKEDDGVALKMSDTYESAERSYYTKKFFGRNTEFYFKKPCIEARWDSSIHDDRGNFYYSSSLATAAENLNTLYLYNYFRGRLRDIPGVSSTQPIYVSIFSGSSNDSGIDTAGNKPCVLFSDLTYVSTTSTTAVTGGWVSTGIYSASFAITGNAPSSRLETLYDVWFSGSNTVVDARTGEQYWTGSITPKVLDLSTAAPASEYAIAIKNLKNVYRHNETARFRVYTRQKDWSPTVYTKSVASAQVDIIDSGSFEIYRVPDDLKVIPYGTGSDYHTVMSYDASGSYFNLDMNMLEPGYMYGIKFAFYNEDVGAWVEQPDGFKFRVESRQS